jgi:hypothetical protein
VQHDSGKRFVISPYEFDERLCYRPILGMPHATQHCSKRHTIQSTNLDDALSSVGRVEFRDQATETRVYKDVESCGRSPMHDSVRKGLVKGTRWDD